MAELEPIALFRRWFEEALRDEPFDATATCLATVDADGRPSARMVLLKGADERGFLLVTNYESRKARALDATKRAALCFHWPKAERQVRVEGAVERVDAAESDAYFATRPRGSQIGAWASDQSRELPSRATLEQRLKDVEARFEGGDVPRPPHWGGYLLVPDHLELWQGRPSRLHEREVFDRVGAGWKRVELYP
jgi:pyridoxamine 5'-phosphate oxidase